MPGTLKHQLKFFVNVLMFAVCHISETAGKKDLFYIGVFGELPSKGS